LVILSLPCTTLSLRRRCEMAKKFMYACIGILALAVAFHLGARYGEASLGCSDIAIATQVIHHGEQIPLPYYSDGTQAAQGECTWIVYPRRITPGRTTQGFECRAGSDRVVWMKQYTPSGPYYDSNAQYLIIGVRGGAPSVTQSTTWGGIKAEFGE
jgi:hypothetical protein